MALRILFSVLVLSFVLTGCSSNDADQEVGPAKPVEELYNEAANLLDNGKNNQAAKMFEEVERQYPFSEWATRAELMAAYGYYKDGRYDEAVLALDRYIELHPGNENTDYALYLKALSYYDQITDVARDQEMTERALQSFNALIRRHPSSEYSRDARFKRDLTLDHLAGKEMEIGRYYLTRGHVNAAIGRFRSVVQKYQTTTHIPEALHRLVEAYLTIGLKDEAVRVAAVLGHNYPGSKWYQYSYDLLDDEARKDIVEGRGWMDKTIDSLFNPN